jgi:hypothetical protein
VLAHNSDGRLEAFVRGTDGLTWHQWQSQPGGTFSAWQQLHNFGHVVPVLDLRSRPTVWNQSDGAIAVATVQSDREAFLIKRTSTAPFWTDHEHVGSEVCSEIAAASGGSSSGLFALGPTRDLRVQLIRP